MVEQAAHEEQQRPSSPASEENNPSPEPKQSKAAKQAKGLTEKQPSIMRAAFRRKRNSITKRRGSITKDIDVLSILRKIPICAGLTLHQLEHLAGAAVLSPWHKEDDVIIRQGEKITNSSQFFIIVAGRVRCKRGERAGVHDTAAAISKFRIGPITGQYPWPCVWYCFDYKK